MGHAVMDSSVGFRPGQILATAISQEFQEYSQYVLSCFNLFAIRAIS